MPDKADPATQNPVPAPECFRFGGFTLSAEAGTLDLHYAFEGGPEFTERLDFHTSFADLPSETLAAVELAAALLSAVAGVSYYKLFAPKRLDFGGLALSAEARAFVADTYRWGLAEFAHRNELTLGDRLNFTGGGAVADASSPAPIPSDKSLVLIGGGKDSLVSLAAMQAAGEDFALFAVNPRGPMTGAAEVAGKPLIKVTRSLDPLLFEWNEKPGTFNGHVPITAIVSLIAVIAALVHGYGNVILSNERSADEPTLIGAEGEVNHQFSKSTAFEEDFAALIAREVHPDLAYFSLLRPLSEPHIARTFAKRDDFDTVFTSCNRAFALRDRPDALWCGDCAKCRFTFLLLAPAMSPERLLGIFPANLLDDPAQEAGYRDLMGIGLHKPWDCVGEERESALTLALLARDPVWQDTAIVRKLAAELQVSDEELERGMAEILAPEPAPLPAHFRDLIHAYAAG
ncbi:hypothetical protein [uncultured Erythrobacter sp.]|uniref:hypothetical protein n=1 Tax=uncultured Erythrobacter sp. TaxID=263913 RepID=UPI00260A29C9|nr:hypothetical protein [uncultured Erythrobacter sp.]